jgi:hypothetical protein
MAMLIVVLEELVAEAAVEESRDRRAFGGRHDWVGKAHLDGGSEGRWKFCWNDHNICSILF